MTAMVALAGTAAASGLTPAAKAVEVCPRYPDLATEAIPFTLPMKMLASYQRVQGQEDTARRDVMDRLIGPQGRPTAALLAREMMTTRPENILEAWIQLSFVGNPDLSAVDAVRAGAEKIPEINEHQIVEPSHEMAERMVVALLAFLHTQETFHQTTGLKWDPVADAVRPVAFGLFPDELAQAGGVTHGMTDPLERIVVMNAAPPAGAIGGSPAELTMNWLEHELYHQSVSPAFRDWVYQQVPAHLQKFVEEMLTECLATELWTGNRADNVYEGGQNSARVCLDWLRQLDPNDSRRHGALDAGLLVVQRAYARGDPQAIERLTGIIRDMVDRMDARDERQKRLNTYAMPALAVVGIMVVYFVSSEPRPQDPELQRPGAESSPGLVARRIDAEGASSVTERLADAERHSPGAGQLLSVAALAARRGLPLEACAQHLLEMPPAAVGRLRQALGDLLAPDGRPASGQIEQHALQSIPAEKQDAALERLSELTLNPARRLGAELARNLFRPDTR